MNHINKKILHFRTCKNISRRQLADMSGLSQSYITDLERSSKKPSLKSLHLLSSALNIPIHLFFLDDKINNEISFYIDSFLIERNINTNLLNDIEKKELAFNIVNLIELYIKK